MSRPQMNHEACRPKDRAHLWKQGIVLFLAALAVVMRVFRSVLRKQGFLIRGF